MSADAAVAGARPEADAPAAPAAPAAPVAPAATLRPPGPVRIGIVVIAAVAVIALARFAEAFLVPVVAGILLSYALRPLVTRLVRLRVPRFAAAALVILVVVGVLGGTLWAIRDDVSGAIAELPAAARKIRLAAVDAERRAPGAVSHVKAVAAEIARGEAEASARGAVNPAAAAAAATAPSTSGGWAGKLQEFLAEQSGKALSVLLDVGVALLLAFFVLGAGDAFRRKVARLAGTSLARRRLTVEALDEIDAHIQAYLLSLLAANVLVALATWGVLALMGLPNAGMWAAAFGVLHTIPYAGTAVAATAIGLATYVHSGAVGDAVLALTAVTTIAVVIGMGLATWIQGRATHMNAAAVFVGILFFGWLWGGWGLLLGMPILTVLKSVADRTESMRPVSELLSG